MKLGRNYRGNDHVNTLILAPAIIIIPCCMIDEGLKKLYIIIELGGNNYDYNYDDFCIYSCIYRNLHSIEIVQIACL